MKTPTTVHIYHIISQETLETGENVACAGTVVCNKECCDDVSEFSVEKPRGWLLSLLSIFNKASRDKGTLLQPFSISIEMLDEDISC